VALDISNKKIFLTVSASNEKLKWIADTINKHVTNATIFAASDGLIALNKLQNAPPHVLITDIELPKVSAPKLIDVALKTWGNDKTAVIITAPPPTEENYLDEIVTGRVQYYAAEPDNEEVFTKCLMRALNFTSHKQEAEFLLRFLVPGELLLKEGDKADFVYFVKKGRLRAFQANGSAEVELGFIDIGEFVGEMAYVNGEPRNASVQAVTNCELIEVEVGKVDSVLFKRPAWSKAMMMTLIKRLKASNAAKVKKS
jgi:CRP/FNR family transcriptional regulator, cyclic AMP receptor protein